MTELMIAGKARHQACINRIHQLAQLIDDLEAIELTSEHLVAHVKELNTELRILKELRTEWSA